MTSEIRNIAIVGGGKMGGSLFHYLTKYDFNLVWVLRSDVEKTRKKYHRKLKRALKNELINTEEFDFRMQHHQISDTLQPTIDSDLVIECIREELKAKQELMLELSHFLKPNALIASNSSSILPEKLISSTDLKNRTFGLHFFFPLETKIMVEMVQSDVLSQENSQRVQGFLNKIDKTILIQGKKDAFLLNRLMLRFQALVYKYTLESDYSFAQIDTVSSKLLFPMGIFEMMDYIGLDLIHQSAKAYLLDQNDKSLYQELMNFMESKIQSNHFGICTNQGFYTYPKESDNKIISENQEKEIIKNLRSIFDDVFIWASSLSGASKQELEFSINDYLDTDINEWHKLI
ncbi:MAG: hypothetical protein DRI84_05315 [Bacteroidetes bacterium]|nr:MAG: hypothetical protein DRI84_05315 [Bacteroidota bacterium]